MEVASVQDTEEHFSSMSTHILLYMWCRNTSCDTSLLYFGSLFKIKRWSEVLCIGSAVHFLDRLNRKILFSSCEPAALKGVEESIIILGNMAKSELSISEKEESKTDLCDALANMRNRGCMLIGETWASRRWWEKYLHFFGLMQYASLSPLETVGSIQVWVTSGMRLASSG